MSNRSTDLLRSGCVASLVRMALYVKHLKGYDDPTWQTYPEQLWSYVVRCTHYRWWANV